jgi:hypothetical protein
MFENNIIPASPAGTYIPSGALKRVPIHQHPALISIQGSSCEKIFPSAGADVKC